MLTLMPGNVPKIANSFANNMIGSESHFRMFAIQLQRQSRGSIYSTRESLNRYQIITRQQLELGTYKIKLSSHSCCPFFCLTFRSFLFYIIQLQFDTIGWFSDCAHDAVRVMNFRSLNNYDLLMTQGRNTDD